MKIEELIDRYFEGQTSCEEERELRSFFTQENVTGIVTSISSLVCLPGSGSKKHFRQESAPVKKPSFRRRFIYTAGGIAAGILLVIGIAGTQRYLHPHSGKLRHYRRQAIHGCKPGA